MTREAILAEILKLPVREQERLLAALEELVPVPDDAPIPDWLKEELDRCLEDTPENVANLSWDEVRKNLGIPEK
jgi:hypothetical protein